MKADYLLSGIALALIAVLLFQTAYAYSGDARTYSEGNESEVQYISVSLDGTQYSSAVTSDVTYHTITVIDAGGRSVRYVPDHSGSITVSETTYPVTEIVQFDLTLATKGSDPIPEYTLYLTVDDPLKFTGTFIASYWTDPEDDATRVDVIFPVNTGIQITDLTVASMKICLFVSMTESAVEPAKPLADAAFKFRTAVEE